MHHFSFSSSFALRIMSLLLLGLLAACGSSPAPNPSSVEVSPLLGVAELGKGIDTQSLVPGLQFSEVNSELVDVDGMRIQQVTFEVVNTSDQNITNLSLYSVQTDVTTPGTNITDVKDSAGNAITNPATIQAMQPTQGRFGDGSIDPDKADQYDFTTTDQAATQDLLDTNYPNNSFVVLEKGFIASNASGQSNRTINIGETGVVTIAYEYPYTNTPSGTPDSFDLYFAFVNEPTAKAPQSTGPATFQLSVTELGISTTEGIEVETNIATNLQGAIVTVGQ
ncbi:MAG: hypothetical protein AAF267_21465 [Deinococcota bacterium]